MKNNIKPIILLIASFVFCCSSCTSNTPKKESDTNETSDVVEINQDTVTTSSEENKPLTQNFSSNLRPNENLELGKIYTDTVTFLNFIDDYDEWYIAIEKNNDTTYIINNDENTVSEYFNGNQIIINWKIDSIRYAGDIETLAFKEFLVASKKTATNQNQKVNILWREVLYDEALKMDINTIVLNTAYQKFITPQERAALGYVATFVGSECEWEGGQPDQNKSNLNCQLLTYLNLGNQCSEKHLSYLNQWFSEDTTTIEKLKVCPKIPNTATIQTTFNKVHLTHNSTAKTLLVEYEIMAINVRENENTQLQATELFQYDLNHITLIESTIQDL